MKQPDRNETPNCPFLVPEVSDPLGPLSLPVYCRLPNGRVRIPTRDQLAYLCSAGHHQNCPGYDRWAPPRAVGWPSPAAGFDTLAPGGGRGTG